MLFISSIVYMGELRNVFMPLNLWVISVVNLLPLLVGLGVTCSPRDPKFACSNLAEVDGFFQDVKILSTSPPGRTLGWGSRV